jgi:hypothetical protein
MPFDPVPEQGNYTMTHAIHCYRHQRYKWLSRSLRLGESDFAFIFYHYLVQEYKDHPNKKRAIFVFDRCLTVNDLAQNQMDLSVNYSRRSFANFANLEQNINLCKEMRAWAWWKKLGHSAEEMRPTADLFDGITASAIDGGVRQDEMASGVEMGLNAGSPIKSQPGYRDAKAKVPTLKSELAAVGFDTERLGVDHMVLA